MHLATSQASQGSSEGAGKQHWLDASVAYKRAVLNCVHYLAKFGYTKEQVDLLPLNFRS